MGAPPPTTPAVSWGKQLSGSFHKLRRNLAGSDAAEADKLSGQQPAALDEPPPSPKNAHMDKRWLGMERSRDDYVPAGELLKKEDQAARPQLETVSSTVTTTEESMSVADSAASLTGDKRHRPKSHVLRSLSSAVHPGSAPAVDGGNVRRITVSSFHRRVTDLGRFEDLTSPVMTKIGEAFLYSKAAFMAPVDKPLLPHSKVVKGYKGSAVHVTYEKDDRVLILAFKGMLDSPVPFYHHNDLTSIPTTQPAWLQRVAPEARVHQTTHDYFGVLVRGEETEDGPAMTLATAIKEVTGGEKPRRILCCGYCFGGGIATLAATWAALQVPTADTRCITFGAPRVGNFAFVDAFKWLVGLSYRCVYERDAVVDKPRSAFLTSFHGVHGMILLNADGDCQARTRRLVERLKPSFGDHHIMKYKAALQGACKRSGCILENQAPTLHPPATGEAEPLGEPPLPAVPEAAEGSVPRAPGPAIPAETAERGMDAAGQAARDAEPDAATQPVITGVDPGNAGGDSLGQGSLHKVHVGFAGLEANTADPPSPAGVVEGLREDSAVESGGGSDGGDDSGDASGHGTRAANLTISTGVRGGLKMHDSSGDSAADSPAMSRQNSSAALDTPRVKLPVLSRLTSFLPWMCANSEEVLAGPEDPANNRGMADKMLSQAIKDAVGENTGITTAAPRWLHRTISALEAEEVEVNMTKLDAMEQILVLGKLMQPALLSWAAYRDQEVFRRRSGMEKSVLISEPRTGTQVQVAWSGDGTAVFAFRGTSKQQDAWQDLKLLRRSIPFLEEMYPGVKAHVGFQQQLSAVLNAEDVEHNIGEALKKLSGGRQPGRVICTGHSLGGALATLCATWCAIEYPKADVRCVSFGSPRVGNTKFKAAFHALVGTSLRVVYNGDPIPTMPPAYKYHHVDGAIFLSHNKMGLHARPWHWKYRLNVGDHFLSRYNGAMTRLLPEEFFKQGVDGAKTLGKKAAKKARRGV